MAYDSVFGRYAGEIETRNGFIVVDGEPLEVLREPEPAGLPWEELEVDMVVESTGRLRSREQATVHLDRGAGRVLVAAPVEGADLTVCLGVNSATSRTPSCPRTWSATPTAPCSTPA